MTVIKTTRKTVPAPIETIQVGDWLSFGKTLGHRGLSAWTKRNGHFPQDTVHVSLKDARVLVTDLTDLIDQIERG